MQTIEDFKECWNLEPCVKISAVNKLKETDKIYTISYEIFCNKNFINYLHQEKACFEVLVNYADGCRWTVDGKYYLKVLNKNIKAEYFNRITKFEIFYMENYDCQ